MNNKSLDKFAVKALEQKSIYDISITKIDLNLTRNNSVYGFDIVYKYNDSDFYINVPDSFDINNVSAPALSFIEKDIQAYNYFSTENFSPKHSAFIYKKLKISRSTGIEFINNSYEGYAIRDFIFSYIKKQVELMRDEYSFKVLYSKAMLDFCDIYKVQKEAELLGLS